MSATIPAQIKEKFDNEYQKIQSSGRDNKGNEKNPFIFEYHNSEIVDNETVSDEFLKLLMEYDGQNVGIIVNTVPQSKMIFNELKQRFPERQILLYNSQFMRKDRPKKEKILRIFGKSLFEELNQEEIEFCKEHGFDPDLPFVFVGTQVAEISLNNSFDVLISELAPLDALIQRGGRLHRKMSFNNNEECNCHQCKRFNNKHTYKFHIFDTGEFCFPYYTPKDKDGIMNEIIENTRKQITENTLFTFKTGIKMMDNVYKNEKMFSEFNADISFWDAYVEDLIFGKSPKKSEEEGGQLRIQTRNIKMNSFAVLPQQFEYENDYIQAEDFIRKIYGDSRFSKRGKLNFEGINEITKHMIKIPIKQYYKINSNKDRYFEAYKIIKIACAEYDFEKGLVNLDDQENVY